MTLVFDLHDLLVSQLGAVARKCNLAPESFAVAAIKQRQSAGCPESTRRRAVPIASRLAVAGARACAERYILEIESRRAGGDPG